MATISRNQANLDIIKLENALLDAQLKTLTSRFDIEKQNAIQMQIEANNQKQITILEDERLKLLIKNTAASKAAANLKTKEINDLKIVNTEIDKTLLKLKKRNELQTKFLDLMTKNNWLQTGWIKGLMESDKIIRTTILNLGMSGKKADMMRTSFEQSAMAVAQMGGSLKDIQAVQEGYANETGRARIMTAQMVEDIISIGRGTGLGVEEATKLGAQFELMGWDARNTAKAVQGIVDTSERMGVNTTKVLKGVNDNFKRLQTYSFQGGVKGMMQMSQYATKMNIDMNQVLNAADIAKSLEGAIDLAAKLQVMGGEFAKTDPFEMLFLSRNDPEKFTEKINQMTKGIVSFRKTADGSFEKFISPADRDRLASVEKSLGMQTGELTQQALRMSDIQKMRQNMLSSSLSKKDKEMIEGMAIYNKQTGMFQVQIGTTAKNISDITASEAKLFLQQQVTLEKRAKDSLTFQESLEAAIASFKTVLLPMLRGFNVVMDAVKPFFEWFVKPFFEWFAKTLNVIPSDIIAGAGIIVGAGLLFNVAARNIAKAVYMFSGKNMMGGYGNRALGLGGAGGGLGGTIGGSQTKPLRGVGTKTLAAQGAAAKAKGMGRMMAGAGIGAAALGVSQLATAMSKLDKTQIAALPGVILSLGAAFAIATLPLMGMAAAATAGAPGLWTLGVVAAGIGAGIGIAAAGIGIMASGLGEMIKKSKDAGPAMLSVGAGIASMAAGMALFTVGGLGLITFTATLGAIAAFATPIGKVGAAFKEINLAMRGSKEDFAAIESAVNAISNMNTSNGSAFAQLAQLLKTPLKVEFSDKKVQFVSDITMLIDGQKFMQKVYSVAAASTAHVDAKKTGTGK